MRQAAREREREAVTINWQNSVKKKENGGKETVRNNEKDFFLKTTQLENRESI